MSQCGRLHPYGCPVLAAEALTLAPRHHQTSRLPMTAARLDSQCTALVRGGLFLRRPGAKAYDFRETRTIDGRGRYLLPRSPTPTPISCFG